MTTQNADPVELQKFNELAARWWDQTGPQRALHDINPLRLDYIRSHVGELDGLTVLDVGCGGGILSEGLVNAGAAVTALDLSEDALAVAKQHARDSGLDIDYRLQSAESLAEAMPARFDLVCCLEMLEHVPDPAAIVTAAATLLKPGGHAVFSTINRNAKSFALAIVGAEYVLGLIPKGTHEYNKLIRPSELDSAVRAAGLTTSDVTGMHYNPVTHSASLSRKPDVNYFLHATKPA